MFVQTKVKWRVKHVPWLSHACDERWGAGVETQKYVRGDIGGWGRVPFNETYAPSLSTIFLRRGVGFIKFLENGTRPQPPTSPCDMTHSSHLCSAMMHVCLCVCVCVCVNETSAWCTRVLYINTNAYVYKYIWKYWIHSIYRSNQSEMKVCIANPPAKASTAKSALSCRKCVCEYIHIYTYVCVYIYTYTYVCICIYIYSDRLSCVCECVCRCRIIKYVHMHIYM